MNLDIMIRNYGKCRGERELHEYLVWEPSYEGTVV